MRRKQDTNTSNDRRLVRRVPHGKMWRRKLDETKIPNINEVSKDNVEHNKNDVHYVGKKDEDVKEYTDGDEYDNSG